LARSAANFLAPALRLGTAAGDAPNFFPSEYRHVA